MSESVSNDADDGYAQRLGLLRRLGRILLWERDRETGEGRWDAEIFGLFGLPVAERAPSPEQSLALLHPDDREPALRSYRQSLGQPGEHEMRYRVPRADGSTAWLHLIWHVPAQGRRVVGLLIDDSEPVALAQRHTHVRTHLDLAAEVAGIGLWSWDLSSNEQVWSPTMKAIHGMPADAPVPLTATGGVSQSVLPEDQNLLREVVRRLQDDSAPRTEAQWRIRRPDGSVRTLLGSARRLGDGSNVVAGVAMDVTERQAAERLLREKLAAEQGARARSEVLSRMSHELRTPLNAVLGFADLLLADTTEPPRPRQRERLQHLRLAGRQLLSLVDQVLQIVRLDAEGQAGAAALNDALQHASSAAQPPAATTAPAGDGVRHELVYVEDNPVNLLLVQEVLAQRPDLRLHAAGTVREGEDLVRRVRPSLVLVDLHLPDGDGLDLLARLRGGTDPLQVPCIALSADAQKQQIERAIGAGFAAYWTKPIDIASFLEALDQRLRA